MSDLVAWCAFLGAWLLVAGPIYQAVIELQDEEIEGERIRASFADLPKPKPISLWWWLIPPVLLYLQRRRSEQRRRQTLTVLSSSDLEALMHFKSKATGWELVALGASLLALNETYALAEQYEWPIAVFWMLVVVMALISIGNAALRDARTKKILQEGSAGASSSSSS